MGRAIFDKALQQLEIEKLRKRIAELEESNLKKAYVESTLVQLQQLYLKYKLKYVKSEAQLDEKQTMLDAYQENIEEMVSEEIAMETALKDERNAKLQAQVAAVRLFNTSHIHLEDGEVFIKVRRDLFQAAIGEVE